VTLFFNFTLHTAAMQHAFLAEQYPAWTVTGQFANKPTFGQLSRGLVNSRTSQLAEILDLKFGVYNSSKYDFG